MPAVNLPRAHKRAHLGLVAVAALVIALLIGFFFVWLKGGEESTAQETYSSLASSSFTEELPPGIVLDRRAMRRLFDGEEVGRVSFFDVRKTRRAEGGIVVVSYQVFRSPEAAMSAYEGYWRRMPSEQGPRQGLSLLQDRNRSASSMCRRT